eukprot:scaffold339_cov402-Prasinococcus_capsulatus_cf.AAC.22
MRAHALNVPGEPSRYTGYRTRAWSAMVSAFAAGEGCADRTQLLRIVHWMSRAAPGVAALLAASACLCYCPSGARWALAFRPPWPGRARWPPCPRPSALHSHHLAAG